MFLAGTLDEFRRRLSEGLSTARRGVFPVLKETRGVLATITGVGFRSGRSEEGYSHRRAWGE